MTALRDAEGFLTQLDDWSEKTAQDIADDYDITLASAHWHVITTVRNHFKKYGPSPTSRVTVGLLKQSLGKQASSIYLMQLFGGRARRVLAQIAGLPKPTDCD